MKKISVSVLFVLFIAGIACKREKSDNSVNPTILGKWLLVRTVEENYQPVNVLLDSEEYIGTAGDSIIFKSNNTVLMYSDDTGDEEESYELLNDSTIRIEFETYKIRKLTDTELYLHEEETDIAQDEKWVYKLYMKR